MIGNTTYDPDTEKRFLAKKAGIAYIWPGFCALILVLTANILIFRFGNYRDATPYLYWAAFALNALAFARCVLSVMTISSYVLFYDAAGVWFKYGLFPWNRVTFGVMWRNIDKAVYFPTLISWAFRSYDIRVDDRFTQSNSFLLTHMKPGKEAVSEINSYLQQHIREQAV